VKLTGMAFHCKKQQTKKMCNANSKLAVSPKSGGTAKNHCILHQSSAHPRSAVTIKKIKYNQYVIWQNLVWHEK